MRTNQYYKNIFFLNLFQKSEQGYIIDKIYTFNTREYWKYQYGNNFWKTEIRVRDDSEVVERDMEWGEGWGEKI